MKSPHRTDARGAGNGETAAVYRRSESLQTAEEARHVRAFCCQRRLRMSRSNAVLSVGQEPSMSRIPLYSLKPPGITSFVP